MGGPTFRDLLNQAAYHGGVEDPVGPKDNVYAAGAKSAVLPSELLLRLDGARLGSTGFQILRKI